MDYAGVLISSVHVNRFHCSHTITKESTHTLYIDEETAIMHRLQSTILEYSQVLLSVMEHCAELDWYVPAYQW